MNNFYLDLYAFHLCHIFTDAPDEVTAGAEDLWENLVKLGETLKFPELKELRSKLICYENGKYEPTSQKEQQNPWLTHSGKKIEMKGIPTQGAFKIQGSIQPLLLNDTYAVDFSLFPEKSRPIDKLELAHFQPKSFLPDSIQASLGQTLWIYGEVTGSDDDCKALAEDYAIQLMAGTSFNPVLVNQGTLLGSLLFEYQATNSDNSQDVTQQCRILISINNTAANTPALAQEANDWLLYLLCCWHKIRFIYQEARNRYPKAREFYSQLEKQIRAFSALAGNRPTRLDELNTLLKTLPKDYLDYSCCLRDLQAHLTAISTNIHNYKYNLKKIQEIGDVPQFWQDFSRTAEQWRAQIKTDIEYFTPGKELFEQMINSVRGIAEVDQAESDRTLQKTVQLIGFGIGTSAIVAAVAPYWIKQTPDEIPTKPVISRSFDSFFIVLLISLAAGLGMWRFCAALMNRKTLAAGIRSRFTLKSKDTNQPSLPSGQGGDISSISQQQQKQHSP